MKINIFIKRRRTARFPIPVEISSHWSALERLVSTRTIMRPVPRANRGFILTIDRSPQQSDRRFRRYTVLPPPSLNWDYVNLRSLTKFVKGKLVRARSDGRGMEAKT